jgi:hypothetical protein
VMPGLSQLSVRTHNTHTHPQRERLHSKWHPIPYRDIGLWSKVGHHIGDSVLFRTHTERRGGEGCGEGGERAGTGAVITMLLSLPGVPSLEPCSGCMASV